MALAHSYSTVKLFEQCPWRYYLTKVSKQVKEPPFASKTGDEGLQIHRALENHINGKEFLPERYSKYLPVAERVKAVPGRVQAERRFALTASFAETTFFGKDVWLRGVFDVEAVTPSSIVVLDWKYGKIKPDSTQLDLFAASAFKLYPTVSTVHTGYVWLQHNKLDRRTYTKEDSAQIWQDFLARTQRIEIALEKGVWPKRPSGLCREYCPVGRNMCEHCGT